MNTTRLLAAALQLLFFATICSAWPFQQKHIQKRAGGSVGPVIRSDFPDPSLIDVNGTWYSFATGTTRAGKGYRIQSATSDDFDNWTLSDRDAMAFMPQWVNKSRSEFWAPDVVQVDDGSFVMYFSARANFGIYTHCVGAATSPSINIPFNPLPDPLFCPQEQGGAIDASGFQDMDGTRYVVYKVDGNTLGHGGSCNNFIGEIVPTPIMLQKVRSDGVRLEADPPVTILDRMMEDGPLVEAPSMMVRDGMYYLFYSGNCWSSLDYNVAWATSANILGPYERTGELFATGINGLEAPGGASVAADGVHMVFHARSTGHRSMHTTQLSVDGAQVLV